MRRSFLLCLLGALLLWLPPAEVCAQADTVLMAVLNSSRHAWGSDRNPGVGMFTSPDGGWTWHHIGWKEYIRVFSLAAGSDGVLWAACGNGVLRSTDGGLSWRITTGSNVTEVLRVSIDPASPSRLFAATAYGVIRSTDRGETWTFSMGDVATTFTSDVCVDRSNGRHIVLATEGGIYRTVNGGQSWSLAGMAGSGIRTIVQDFFEPLRFYAGTEEDGVALSTDGGQTWRVQSAGLLHRTVYVIACHPSAPDTIYAGTHGGGVYRSTDRGLSWAPRSTGLLNLVVHALVVLPGTPTTLLAGTLNGGLFRSVDSGRSWSFASQEDAQVWGLSLPSRRAP